MLLALLVLTLITQIQGQCPLRCNCTKNTIDCVAKDLEYVPDFENLSYEPVIIDLSGNLISLVDIDAFSFDKSDQVIEVYLNKSQVISIEERALEELENLQSLYLNDNLLSSLPQNFIFYNENLMLLDLSRNYFADMPMIKSESLEVMSIANSGISRMSSHALDGLPNLRILLISANNLKRINPATFDHVSNLFFVRLAYNPWQCNCRTIKLFDYLTERKFIDLTEPVLCLNEAKNFVNIYNDQGAIGDFKQECKGIEVSFVDSQEVIDSEDLVDPNFNLEADAPTASSIHNKSLDKETENFTTQGSNSMSYTSVYYLLLLIVTIVVSLSIGAILGSCITLKYINRHSIPQTESTKELIESLEGPILVQFS